MNEVFKDIDLSDLVKFENLSNRVYNICSSASLGYLSEIMDFYLEYRTFLKLRNCGKKTNNELIKVCRKYEEGGVVE